MVIIPDGESRADVEKRMSLAKTLLTFQKSVPHAIKKV